MAMATISTVHSYSRASVLPRLGFSHAIHLRSLLQRAGCSQTPGRRTLYIPIKQIYRFTVFGIRPRVARSQGVLYAFTLQVQPCSVCMYYFTS